MDSCQCANFGSGMQEKIECSVSTSDLELYVPVPLLLCICRGLGIIWLVNTQGVLPG